MEPMRNLFFGLVVSFVFLLVSPVYVYADTQVRGDYDGDGYQDIAVALVRSVGSSYRTEMLARGSSGKKISYAIPIKADAFANGKYFAEQPTTLAAVTVTSTSSPLLWTFVNPVGSKRVKLRYGQPGDTILNAINFDGDSLDDVYVVREGAADELNDGKKYMHWLIAMSGSNGSVVDVVFGVKGDRLFTFYKDGKPNLGAWRIEKTGSCANKIAWYYMEYNADPALRRAGTTCWGSSKDMPMIPAEIDGRLKVAVSRTSRSGQVAYVRDFDGTETTTTTLGSVDSIPGFAALSEGGTNFFWHQRAVAGSGGSSFVVIKGSNGAEDEQIKFGVERSIILRPDGSVVSPTDGAGCSNMVSIGNLFGVLYKPSNLHGGRGPTFIVQDVSQRTGKRQLKIRDMNCREIAAFGLYATDYPYGARYYMKSGGTGQSSSQLLALARRAGSSAILVEGVNSTWIKVQNPENREGALRK